MNCHDAAAPETSSTPTKTIALAGNPNVGKSTLFNRLTGAHQKIANYPGVTVEKKTGSFVTTNGQNIRLIDLPGAYSLHANSEDEIIAAKCLLGQLPDTPKPDAVLVIIEAANLDRGLVLFKQIQAVHSQAVLVLNMMDELKILGVKINSQKLGRLLGTRVIEASAKSGFGLKTIVDTLEELPSLTAEEKKMGPALVHEPVTQATFTAIDEITKQVVVKSGRKDENTEALDAIFLHPIFGPLIFLAVMFVVFQSLFTWSAPLTDFIDSSMSALGTTLASKITTPWLKSLIADGIVAGVGSVVVFVPQIAITFILIGILEMTGYLARGAFLIDRLMRSVGLEGRAFIPLISSFACAVPGIMATRTIPNSRQRLITILIAPLMTCSARLPVYTLLIASFVPATRYFGLVSAQGLTLFGLFLLGIFSGLFVSLILNKLLPGGKGGGFFLELPRYRMPTFKNLYYYVSFRTGAFLKTAGTVIFILSVVLWALAYFPRPQAVEDAYSTKVETVRESSLSDDKKAALTEELENEKAGEFLRQSYMGRLGLAIEPALRPMGFDWKLGVAIVGSFAAREVFVSTLGIVFNLGEADENSQGLRHLLRSAKSSDGGSAYTLATALSLLVFFALAAQCMSTLAVIRRETNSNVWPAVVFLYMSALAYLLAMGTYQGLSLVL